MIVNKPKSKKLLFGLKFANRSMVFAYITCIQLWISIMYAPRSISRSHMDILICFCTKTKVLLRQKIVDSGIRKEESIGYAK